MNRGLSLTESALLVVVAFFLVAASLVVIGPAVTKVVDTSRSHAIERHGVAVVSAASKCFSDPATKRYTIVVRKSKKIEVCQDGENFFFQVLLQTGGAGDKAVWSEITKYHKTEVKALGDLIKFVAKYGYELIYR